MKRFNITGTCIPEKHYMVDTSKKIQKIIQLVEEGLYFTINRPRQYGKTTTLSLLYKRLLQSPDYLIIRTSFEGVGDNKFSTEESFSSTIFSTFADGLKHEKEEIKERLISIGSNLKSFEDLSKAITKFISEQNRKVILLIDEVDKASNHIIFLNFLGMLRNKYLNAADGIDQTFHSVVLAGVHDVKNIKKKMLLNSGEGQPSDGQPSVSAYNSPWNIATEFKVDMSFSAEEIGTMLEDYFTNSPVGNGHVHYLRDLQNEIYKFTSGYPFLVSKICKVIDEELDRDWSVEGVQNAINLLLKERNTLFDDLIKNIENYTELRDVLQALLVDEKVYNFNIDNPIIDRGFMYGIFKSSTSDKLMVHNKIFEIRIYNYLISKLELSNIPLEEYTFQDNYIGPDGSLNMEYALLKFQEFIKNTYSTKDIGFYERHGRLLLIAFIKPIINGSGFYYIESQHSYERRSDMIITFNKKEYILELKLWYGKEYHEKGLKQLAHYLESRNQSAGYLVIFNFKKNKEFTNQWNEVDDKKIFEVVV